MAKSTPGLRKKGKYWHIEKTIAGRKLCESTGETELDAAERYLAKRVHEIRSTVIYGERIERTFDEAAARYVEEFGHKKSMDREIFALKAVMPYIEKLTLKQIHSGSLDGYVKDRKAAGIQVGTINRDIAVAVRVLRLAARLWRDDQGRPWLDTVPMFQKAAGVERKPRPISSAEEANLLPGMPQYLKDMVLFALNTGLRDQEICSLKWDNEAKVSGLDASVFIITDDNAKNGRERIVPLNGIARSIVNRYRGQAEYVFHLEGKRLNRMSNRAWRKARIESGLEDVRVHDLRHTFGMRLRAAGVSFEDRQDLLGHYAGRITTHYSKVEISRLIDCVELLCENRKPELTLIRRVG